jgi:hypothetical protein
MFTKLGAIDTTGRPVAGNWIVDALALPV